MQKESTSRFFLVTYNINAHYCKTLNVRVPITLRFSRSE